MILFMCYVSTEVLRVLSSTWLSVWTDESTPKNHGPGFYNLIYSLLSFCQVCLSSILIAYLPTVANSFHYSCVNITQMPPNIVVNIFHTLLQTQNSYLVNNLLGSGDFGKFILVDTIEPLCSQKVASSYA